jgi:hypothetical protein
MKQMGIRGKGKKKFVKTTDSREFFHEEAVLTERVWNHPFACSELSSHNSLGAKFLFPAKNAKGTCLCL